MRNVSADLEAVTNLRRSYTGSQQIGPINGDMAVLIIEFDFAEPGMCIPVH